VDEVLAYLQNPVLDIIRRVTKKDWKLEDFKVWDLFSVLDPEQRKEVFAEMAVPGFCLNLEPIPGSPEAIKELQGLVDVFAVTNPHESVLWVTERYEWLRVRFGLDKDHVVFTSAKHIVSGNWLVEDHVDQLLKWKEHNPTGTPILWNTINNKPRGYNHLRAYDWEDVMILVQRALP
jgi:5'(3')-deoxyribonucleotidase